MKRSLLVAALVLTATSCDDTPSTPNRGPIVAGTTQPRDPNKPQFVPQPRPGSRWLPITRSFDGHVVDKQPGGFVFQGLSGKKYLLLPTHHLTEKSADELAFINYDQVRAGHKLRVYLSVQLPYVPVYLCEGVMLHGVKLGDGRSLFPSLDDVSDQ